MYAQKEDLLHEVLELEAEKGLLVSNEATKYQVSVIVTVSAGSESQYIPHHHLHFYTYCSILMRSKPSQGAV